MMAGLFSDCNDYREAVTNMLLHDVHSSPLLHQYAAVLMHRARAIIFCLSDESLTGALLSACGDANPSEPVWWQTAADLACASYDEVRLERGQSRILSAEASSSCIRFPSKDSPSEYLAVVYSASGETSALGIS